MSSGVGFLALFGVSVQTGVIMVEYINQLRARGHRRREARMEGAVLRLRPIMMTMLVATLGLLPAALSHGIGSDSQRPFAIVIVGGLLTNLAISVSCCRRSMWCWRAGRSGVSPAIAEEASPRSLGWWRFASWCARTPRRTHHHERREDGVIVSLAGG